MAEGQVRHNKDSELRIPKGLGNRGKKGQVIKVTVGPLTSAQHQGQDTEALHKGVGGPSAQSGVGWGAHGCKSSER